VLTIDERIKEDGTRELVTLDVEAGELVLTVGSECMRLPVEALDRVMARYGKPLAPEILLDGPSLHAGGGRVLYGLRHLARYDVIARDYVTYSVPGHDALCALATTVAGALAHLGRAYRDGTGGAP
jgi:hypothetical protein